MATHITIKKASDVLGNLDPGLLMWVHSGNEIAIGTTPAQAQYVLDLATENLRRVTGTGDQTVLQPRLADGPLQLRMLRQSGRYLFEIFGKTVECASLKEMLKKGLLAIEESRPGMLDELTKLRPRTKRIVARKAVDLFADQELVKNYADRLTEGWWYGTNNSASETRVWLRRACECANLRWEKEFDVSI